MNIILQDSKLNAALFLTVGLASPVSRGGRKSKKKERDEIDEIDEIISDDWTKDEKFDSENHLDIMYKKHLLKHSNK